MLTVGELFAGIGGFGLGFERAGFQVKWQVEIDDYATRVLEKHWPGVERFRDVRECGAHNLAPVDVVCGGFPCQPHSLAGKRGGAADDRDLWPEFRRIIRELKPRWIVAENVAGLLSNDAGRFFGDILRDLAESGFDAEWDCIPASAVGAPHQRDRVWLVAYANGGRQQERAELDGQEVEDSADWDPRRQRVGGLHHIVADSYRERSQERFVFTGVPGEAGRDDDGEDAAVGSWWATEPAVGRVAHGIPARVDRLRCLGNAVVPQIPEWIARRILDAEGVTA